MINLAVDDLDGILASCAKHGVEANVFSDDSNGRFAHILDPEGTRIELWEPIRRRPDRPRSHETSLRVSRNRAVSSDDPPVPTTRSRITRFRPNGCGPRTGCSSPSTAGRLLSRRFGYTFARCADVPLTGKGETTGGWR